MKQYLTLLKEIKKNGTIKPAARENMPGTTSLFGYQFRHNLQEGFPLLTTKKMFWKGVVVELLWFLRGDTNIKYLLDHDVNIWNEDAYTYYLKKCKKWSTLPKGTVGNNHSLTPLNFDNFIAQLKRGDINIFNDPTSYKLGDCGYQYGKVWRSWKGKSSVGTGLMSHMSTESIDQIKNLVEGLQNNPESRRHVITAWDPARDQDLALTWCHALFQFNCRPIDVKSRREIAVQNRKKYGYDLSKHDIKKSDLSSEKFWEQLFPTLDELKVPKYYLDCQLYQRSADVVLGVPFNIASYALLTHIIAKICNMVPGEFIHSFGDVHIYDNHIDAVEEQLSRTPDNLPQLQINGVTQIALEQQGVDILGKLDPEAFQIINYNPQPAIKAELSTGLKKK